VAKPTPDAHLTWYVISYFPFMTRAEWRAHRTFITEAKIQAGYSPETFDLGDRTLIAAGGEPLRTSDPEALSLMTDGLDAFLRRTRDRILRDHADQVVLNYCPKCGGLAKTPMAQQCHWCFHDWHPRNPIG